MKKIMNYWEGEKVNLRGIEPGDADFFYQWNKETETQKHLDSIWFPSSLFRQEKWVEKQSLKAVDDDTYFFVIENKQGAKVGMIHTQNCDKKNGTFGYGLGIIQKHRNNGYAKEAIQMVLTYYFNELRYHKVLVDVFEFNFSSIALHEKLGFKKEGQLREMKYTEGRYYDVLKYGLLRNEFNH